MVRPRKLPSPAGRRLLLAFGMLIVVLAGATTAAASLRPADLLAAVNRVRAQHGLAPLALDPALAAAARSHTRDMLRHDYFGHGSGRQGVTFRARLGRVRPRLAATGEVLAWLSARASAPLIVARWLASPPHRAVILSPVFTRIGFGIAAGALLGRANAIACTADLGRPQG